MFPRVRLICLWVVALATAAAAQGVRRGPAMLSQIPEGVVYVSQRVDLTRQIEAEDSAIWTLDGEAPPRMQITNVTIGIVIDDAGHIVTRLSGVTPAHPPDNLMVMLPRGNPTPAKFIGLDAVSGLCVLQIEDKNFKAPAFSRSSVLPPQLIIKLFGFNPKQGQNRMPGFTMLKPRINEYPGRITKARNDFRYSVSNQIYYLLSPQLTPVQDGSLVFESNGSIFGLAVYDPTGEGQNIVYPINRVRTIAQTVIATNGSIVHGWLGAMGKDAPMVMRPSATNRMTREGGVQVTNVVPDSPAWVAGVKQQDLLLSINGRHVDTVAKLSVMLKQLPADSEISLEVKRGNEHKILPAKLTPAPAIETSEQVKALTHQLAEWEHRLNTLTVNDPEHMALEPKVNTLRAIITNFVSPAQPEVRLLIFYGFEIQPLTTQLAQYFAVPSGVLVSTVAEGGKAARAGLQAGDIVIKIGERGVGDVVSVSQALDEPMTETVEITISRQHALLKLTFPR